MYGSWISRKLRIWFGKTEKNLNFHRLERHVYGWKRLTCGEHQLPLEKRSDRWFSRCLTDRDIPAHDGLAWFFQWQRRQSTPKLFWLSRIDTCGHPIPVCSQWKSQLPHSIAFLEIFMLPIDLIRELRIQQTCKFSSQQPCVHFANADQLIRHVV